MSLFHWLQRLIANPSSPRRNRASRRRTESRRGCLVAPQVEALETRRMLASQAIIVRKADVTVTEGRSNVGVLEVRLNTQPAANVTVSIIKVSGDPNVSLASSSALTFTSTNWDSYQRVQFSATEDNSDILDGAAIFRLSSSGLLNVEATVRERDNDRPLAIQFEQVNGAEVTSITAPETRTGTMLVRLSADPGAARSVTVTKLAGSDADLATIRGATLTFDSTNWERFQPVVVQAAADADSADGSAIFQLSSAGLPLRNVSVFERDDDLPTRTITSSVLVDDFVAQPTIGDQQNDQEFSFYNRLGGDRGEIFNPGLGQVDWGNGYVEARILANDPNEIAGAFESLNLTLAEQLPLNLHAMLPAQILAAYQMRAKTLVIEIASGGCGEFHVELKNPQNVIRLAQNTTLTGQAQTIRINLPSSGLNDVQLLTWFIKGGIGNSVRVKRISLESESMDTGSVAPFLSAYAPLLNNFDPVTGLTRDRANFPSGDFDNVSASGLQALAAAVASQIGVISVADAQLIVQKTTDALLALPREHGILAHFVRNGVIVPGTEYSSLDTIIAWLALLQANQSLGMSTSAIEVAFSQIDWFGANGLILPNGTISHGYDASGVRLTSGWDTFGGETFLAVLGFAMSRPTDPLPTVPFPTPATANGSGFIDELAWLFVPTPPVDIWNNDWAEYRNTASTAQVTDAAYHSGLGPLFGASAAEQPEPWHAPDNSVYQAYGLGGRFDSRNDGSQFFGEAVASPHYAAMVAELQPQAANSMLDFLTQRGLFNPLNSVESVYMGLEGAAAQPHWNSLKGSWNLGLTALGLGKQLQGTANYGPYATAASNSVLQQGLQRLKTTLAAPVIDLFDAPVTYVENGPPLLLDVDATVTDANSTNFDTGSLIVALTANAYPGDRLGIRNQGVALGQIGVSGNNVTFGGTTIGTFVPFVGGVGATPLTITFNANATPAAVEALLQNITFQTVSDMPSTLTRTVQVSLTDEFGVPSNQPTKTINVTAVNDAPVLSAIEATPLAYTENGAPVPITQSLLIRDGDDTNLESARLQIYNFRNGQDVLTFTNTPNITGTWNPATGTLVLTGTDTVSNYRTALRSVTYHNTSENPTTAPSRLLRMTVNDGTINSNFLDRTITVSAVNDAPVVSNIQPTPLRYVENAPPTVISSFIAVTDIDSPTLTAAQVRISNNYSNGHDVLSFTPVFGINRTWDPNTGTLTLFGTASVQAYIAALRNVRYHNISNNPSTLPRTVEFHVSDGALLSNFATRTINVVAVNDGPQLSAIENSVLIYPAGTTTEATITSSLLAADPDSENLTTARVKINTGYVAGQDVLSMASFGNITATWNAATATLTLTGTDTVSNYREALRRVKYRNTSNTPTLGTKQIQFQVYDGLVNSNVVSRDISVMQFPV